MGRGRTTEAKRTTRREPRAASDALLAQSLREDGVALPPDASHRDIHRAFTKHDLTKHGVRLPLLRFRDVVRRGAWYGAGCTPVTGAMTLMRHSHDDRMLFLGMVCFLALVLGCVGWLFGGISWACSEGDIRRWADWRTQKSRNDGGSIMTPTLIRLGTCCLVLGAVAGLMLLLVNQPSMGTWLYGTTY